MWILFYIIISLLIIYIGHQSLTYITQSFFKKKYVVSSQIDKYKTIIRELQETNDLQTDLEEYMKQVV
jgi:hypothetical protein